MRMELTENTISAPVVFSMWISSTIAKRHELSLAVAIKAAFLLFTFTLIIFCLVGLLFSGKGFNL